MTHEKMEKEILKNGLKICTMFPGMLVAIGNGYFVDGENVAELYRKLKNNQKLIKKMRFKK